MNREIFHEMALKAKDGKPIVNVCLEEIESLRQQLDAAQTEVTRVKEVDFPRKVEAVVAGWKTKFAAQKEHSKEQFEKLLRWVDAYCEVDDKDFAEIEPVVNAVLGEAIETNPLSELRQQLDQLRDLLRPFAALLQEHNSKGPDEHPIFQINDAKITRGDLRRALAATEHGDGHSTTPSGKS
jgi:hypothetical protein